MWDKSGITDVCDVGPDKWLLIVWLSKHRFTTDQPCNNQLLKPSRGRSSIAVPDTIPISSFPGVVRILRARHSYVPVRREGLVVKITPNVSLVGQKALIRQEDPAAASRTALYSGTVVDPGLTLSTLIFGSNGLLLQFVAHE